MVKIFFKLWPFLLINSIVLIFFYPVFLQNKIALPADITVGVYYPWLDYKYPGYPTGIPVKNPITTDVVSFMYPMQMLAIDTLKSGEIPLWNNLILSGAPLLANFQSAPFSLTNVVYWVLPRLEAWNLQIILQMLLSAFFGYFLLREFNRSKLAAVAGGIFYSFSGFSMIWLLWNGHSLTAAFLPLVILLTIKFISTFKIKYGVILSISLVLQIFSGYPQIILYEFLAVFLMVALYNRKIFLDPRRLFLLCIFGILGIGLAAIQILPGIELLSFSQREVEDVVNVGAFLPWRQVITFIAPDFFGSHVTYNYWGSGDYTLNTGFSGIVVLILAGLGILTYWKEKAIKLGVLLVVLALLIALPNPISLLLKQSGLLGLQAASAHRALFLMNLGLAILAAFGIDSLPKLTLLKLVKALILPGILLSSFGLAALILHLDIGFRNLILPSVIFIVVFIVLYAQIYFKKVGKLIPGLLIFIAIFELFRFGWKFTPFIDKQLVFPETPVIKFLKNQPKPFRVSAEDVIPINILMNYDIETTEGYDAVYPKSYAKFLSTLNSGEVTNTPMGRYGSVSSYNSNLLNIANTKYLLTLKRDEKGTPSENGSLPIKFQNPNFKEVFSDKTVVVLENTKSLPRAKMFYQYSIKMGDEGLVTLIDPNFNFERSLLLTEKPTVNISDGSGTVEIMEGINSKNITVDTNISGLLFIADSFYPGWKAFVDEKETKILKADYNFMAIPVDSGTHKVKVVYKPDSFNKGKEVSFGSGIILLILLIFYIFKKHE